MTLYIVRHGEAMYEGGDSQRRLSEKGASEIEKVARFLASAGVRAARILHSPKARAAETAAILSRHIKPEKGVHETEGLLPGDDPRKWVARAGEAGEDLMLVGHMPQLGCLVSLLVSGDMDGNVVELSTGSVVALRKKDGSWSIGWMVAPEILG